MCLEGKMQGKVRAWLSICRGEDRSDSEWGRATTEGSGDSKERDPLGIGAYGRKAGPG